MAMIPKLYWSLALLCCVFCLIRGDRYGRIGAGLFIGTAIASAVAELPGASWARSVSPLLSTDTAYLVALYWLAVRSRRYWPIWLAGFQLASCVTLLAPELLTGVPRRLVEGVESVWAIPILGVMCIGIERDRRARLHRTKD